MFFGVPAWKIKWNIFSRVSSIKSEAESFYRVLQLFSRGTNSSLRKFQIRRCNNDRFYSRLWVLNTSLFRGVRSLQLSIYISRSASITDRVNVIICVSCLFFVEFHLAKKFNLPEIIEIDQSHVLQLIVMLDDWFTSHQFVIQFTFCQSLCLTIYVVTRITIVTQECDLIGTEQFILLNFKEASILLNLECQLCSLKVQRDQYLS